MKEVQIEMCEVHKHWELKTLPWKYSDRITPLLLPQKHSFQADKVNSSSIPSQEHLYMTPARPQLLHALEI